jgi:hypothetical protein
MTPTELFATKIQRSKTLEDSTRLLEILCSDDCSISVCGTISLYEKRHLVANYRGLKVTIRSNEHPPPHFHVLGQGVDASFSISDGALLSGEVTPKHLRAIAFWFNFSRPLLVEKWNTTRPDNCPVGGIKD